MIPATAARIVLHSGKEKPVIQRHPWIFSGAIKKIVGEPQDGDIVIVTDVAGRTLAQGYLNRRSQIAVRLLSWEVEESLDRSFWASRLARAIAGRRMIGLPADDTTACRLVNAESDGLPGLIVDRYGPYLAVQFLTLGIDQRRDLIVDALQNLLAPVGIYERDDVAIRSKEGLAQRVGVLRGAEPPAVLEILERGHHFSVDIRGGQKTGFYLDQRDNRQRVASYAAGREALNCFSYTGGFAVYAARAGAERVTNVDVSADALQLCRRNLALNGLSTTSEDQVAADVFQELRRYREQGRRFDLIILDPPKFADSQSQVMAATRGYKDINLLAMQLLRSQGILATFSCSGRVSGDLFQKVLFGASVDAGREVQILEWLTQAPDHPVLLSFPESAYLKGAICRVI